MSELEEVTVHIARARLAPGAKFTVPVWIGGFADSDASTERELREIVGQMDQPSVWLTLARQKEQDVRW